MILREVNNLVAMSGNKLSERAIYEIELEVRAYLNSFFLHSYDLTHEIVGEGRERDVVFNVRPIHRPFIACLS